MFRKHINKDNLHHAYLIEGESNTLPLLLDFLKENFNINISSNPDLYSGIFDNFKINDARSLVKIQNEKPILYEKKIVVIYANFFSREAQNVLLKSIEDPKGNIIFYLITKDTNNLLKTFISRFYLIPFLKKISEEPRVEVLNFLKTNYKNRIDFIKTILLKIKDEQEDGGDENSPRAFILSFLNEIELFLYKNNIISKKEKIKIFEKLLILRKYIREPSSNSKMLLESLALLLPENLKI